MIKLNLISFRSPPLAVLHSAVGENKRLKQREISCNVSNGMKSPKKIPLYRRINLWQQDMHTQICCSADAYAAGDLRVASRKLSGCPVNSVFPATAWVHVLLLSHFCCPTATGVPLLPYKKRFVTLAWVLCKPISLRRWTFARATAATGSQYVPVEPKVAQICCRAESFFSRSFKSGCCFYEEMGIL